MRLFEDPQRTSHSHLSLCSISSRQKYDVCISSKLMKHRCVFFCHRAATQRRASIFSNVKSSTSAPHTCGNITASISEYAYLLFLFFSSKIFKTLHLEIMLLLLCTQAVPSSDILHSQYHAPIYILFQYACPLGQSGRQPQILPAPQSVS